MIEIYSKCFSGVLGTYCMMMYLGIIIVTRVSCWTSFVTKRLTQNYHQFWRYSKPIWIKIETASFGRFNWTETFQRNKTTLNTCKHLNTQHSFLHAYRRLHFLPILYHRPFTTNFSPPYSTLSILCFPPSLSCLHCKPSPFGKQFCLAYTAILPSYITFQNTQQKIFNPKQMWIYEILICTFGEN
jgi:hypothetical protein